MLAPGPTVAQASRPALGVRSGLRRATRQGDGQTPQYGRELGTDHSGRSLEGEFLFRALPAE
jgi:hypothetical protein